MKTLVIEEPPPVESLIERFGRRRLSFVLDSAQANDGLGEWSFFGADPFAVVTEVPGSARPDGDDGLGRLREAMAPFAGKGAPGIPFSGGAVGFLSYDYGRRIERLPVLAEDDRCIPDLHFGLYDGIAALNHRSGHLHLVALGIRAPEADVLGELMAIVRAEAITHPRSVTETPDDGGPGGAWEWNMSEAGFCDAVRRIRSYIAAGDVYQVNLSRRARRPFSGDPLRLYNALRAGNPAPYGAYLDAGTFHLMSTSPEQFLSKRGRALETRPIKGTRARGKDAGEDRAAAEALQRSVKDRAELLMIVDLERNDFGRVAEFGSVRVEGLYQLEYYAGVIHQTARVKARLAEGHDVFDVIRSVFPGGSITGAPKIRAMEIIEELEPTRRGAYCGSMGYIGFDGDAELNIAIRSLHLKDGFLDYQVGAGIVWDSEPGAELRETLDKGRAIRETIDRMYPVRSAGIEESVRDL